MIQVFVLESKDEREKSDSERGAVTVALGQEPAPTPAAARPSSSQIPPPDPTKSSGFPLPAGSGAGTPPPSRAGDWEDFDPPQKPGAKSPSQATGWSQPAAFFFFFLKFLIFFRISALSGQGARSSLEATQRWERAFGGGGDSRSSTTNCSLCQLAAPAPHRHPGKKRKKR